MPSGFVVPIQTCIAVPQVSVHHAQAHQEQYEEIQGRDNGQENQHAMNLHQEANAQDAKGKTKRAPQSHEHPAGALFLSGRKGRVFGENRDIGSRLRESKGITFIHLLGHGEGEDVLPFVDSPFRISAIAAIAAIIFLYFRGNPIQGNQYVTRFDLQSEKRHVSSASVDGDPMGVSLRIRSFLLYQPTDVKTLLSGVFAFLGTASGGRPALHANLARNNRNGIHVGNAFHFPHVLYFVEAIGLKEKPGKEQNWPPQIQKGFYATTFTTELHFDVIEPIRGKRVKTPQKAPNSSCCTLS